MKVALKDSASTVSALEPISLTDWRTPAFAQAAAEVYWVDSIGRRNAFVSWGFVMGVGNRQRAVREYRGQ
ncbi:hypothetical protein, partial [Streptomyces sp. NPDC058661]|uniref:hypothetical protein n=1 Tax=Streptomyces sp. NPDC058661 TaxID=3346582 RepID=UPI0036574B37